MKVAAFFLFLVVVAVRLAFFGVIGYIAWHFIQKVW